ncbi:hypothetical protein [Corynebacterium pseudotuberculosis]|uniref:Uncharacterized protein n=1 Tax=Corynebacterium pseudotuberculosis (strain C231) TaxID=681645 RepID=D9QEH9_CORP2|nr:hypothetical protein [Corynebacterium pseudotuberculosis]ADL09902.2 hypothetical protein CPC231_02075 [Corynebacterium pseudotuberculosis C231]ADL20309.1 hypothetical protein CP1002_02075 [Corynebacterium pseudotuberculosis 1002]ADO25694.2 hypothetical protein CPI19_02075 [Corynebacterium pseudotuberculosis I19]AFF21564.1 Hypothetical protein CpP54B96_0412 [Corynebacterium pseudotuberculosis P54B96]AFH51330.1 Hypothetical protein Cp267_0423 [Corynebacterium pseudotuberculosis 267]
MAKPDLRQYERAITMLRMVSEGTYSGPLVSSSEVEQAASSTEGLNTKALRQAAIGAVGKTNFSAKNKLWPVLFNVVKQFAMTLIASGIAELAMTWLGGLSGAKNLAQEANQAGDAIDEVDAHANKAITTVLSQLTVAIERLAEQIGTIDKKEDPNGFLHCVQAGADCIDSAAKTITLTCRDRDKAIEACYSQLGASLSKECGRQDAQKASGAVKGQGITVMAQAESILLGTFAASTEEQMSEPASQPCAQEKSMEKTRELKAEALARHTMHGETNEGLCGVLGIFGVGVALIGLSLIVEAVCGGLDSDVGCEEKAPDNPEKPEPEPAPPPRTEEPTKISKVPPPAVEQAEGFDKQKFMPKQQECVPQENKGVTIKKAGAW